MIWATFACSVKVHVLVNDELCALPSHILHLQLWQCDLMSKLGLDMLDPNLGRCRGGTGNIVREGEHQDT